MAAEGLELADMRDALGNEAEMAELLKQLGYASALERARALRVLRLWREALKR